MPELDKILERLAVVPGDNEAWEQLYRKFWPWVFANAFRMLRGDRQLAEDASQDVFIRLLRYCNFENLREPEAFKHYAYIVCRNVTRDYLRRLFHSSKQTNTMWDETQTEGAPREPNQAILSLQAAEMFELLEERDRLLLKMVVDGFDLREVSEKLGITYGNAAVRLHRIRNRLRNYMTQKHLR